jgi:hypothetical protein
MVATRRAAYKWKTKIQRGAAWCPEGIVNDTAITTPVPCSPWHDASHLGLGEPLPLLAAYRRYPPSATGTMEVGFWRGK